MLLPPLTLIGLIALTVFVCMGLEALHAARNERAQLARGGIEPSGDVYALMRVAYPGAFLLMIAEAAWHGAPGRAAVLVAGATVFTLAKLLKWWAIASLGPAWTFRVIIVPGSTLVRSGPYRWLAHPNYVGVVGELVGATLLFAAWVTGPLVTIGFGLLIARRLQVERAALARLVRGRS